MSFPVCAFAQDSGYAPPPMFEDVTAPMVRPEAKDGYIVAPKKSEQPAVPSPAGERPAVITPRVSTDPSAPKAPYAPAAPVAPANTQAPQQPKMMQPIVEEKYIRREKQPAAPVVQKQPVVNAAPAPVPPQKPSAPVPSSAKIEKPRVPASTPEAKSAVRGNTITKEAVSGEERTTSVKRDPKVSAIQGPKTMPALPAGSVDQQALPGKPQAQQDNGETILERHQRESKAEKEALKPIVPAPKAGVAPAAFDRGEKNALKKTIPYEIGQIGLPADIADPIASGVSKELEDKDKNAWRVQIKSFATPHGTGLSSDRRIALSRALSLRSTLITQGIPASRIDVLAEGLETTGGQAGDRIDLYLYPPEKQ